MRLTIFAESFATKFKSFLNYKAIIEGNLTLFSFSKIFSLKLLIPYNEKRGPYISSWRRIWIPLKSADLKSFESTENYLSSYAAIFEFERQFWSFWVYRFEKWFWMSQRLSLSAHPNLKILKSAKDHHQFPRPRRITYPLKFLFKTLSLRNFERWQYIYFFPIYIFILLLFLFLNNQFT